MSFFLSVGVFSLNFGLVFEGRDPQIIFDNPPAACLFQQSDTLQGDPAFGMNAETLPGPLVAHGQVCHKVCCF